MGLQVTKEEEIDGLAFMNMELMFAMANPKKGKLKIICSKIEARES
jgi:hypothetical protein